MIDEALLVGNVDWSSMRPARGRGDDVPALLAEVFAASGDAVGAAEELGEMAISSGWTFAFARALVPHIGELIRASAAVPPWPLIRLLADVAANGETELPARLEITPLADSFGSDDGNAGASMPALVPLAEAQTLVRSALEHVDDRALEGASAQQCTWLAYALSSCGTHEPRWTRRLKAWVLGANDHVAAAAIIALGLTGTATDPHAQPAGLRSLAAHLSLGLVGVAEEGALVEALVECLMMPKIDGFPWGGHLAMPAQLAARRHCERSGTPEVLLKLMERAPRDVVRQPRIDLIDEFQRTAFARFKERQSDLIADDLTTYERDLLVRFARAVGDGVWLGLGLPATHDVDRFLTSVTVGLLDRSIVHEGNSRPIWWVMRGVYRGMIEPTHALATLEAQLDPDSRFDLAIDIASGAYRARRADTCIGNSHLGLLATLVANVGVAVATRAEAYARELLSAGRLPTFAECAVAVIPLALRAESSSLDLSPDHAVLLERANRIWKRSPTRG